MPELYTGVKFNSVPMNRKTVSHRLLTELKKWCALFSEYGFAPGYEGGTSGNLSFRTSGESNGFIITGSYTKLDDQMNNSDFVEVVECIPNRKLILYNGLKNPSSESFMHYYIYSNKPDIGAVFHGHSEEIMKLALKKGYPETEKETEYGTIELAESILPYLDSPVIVIKNHGFLSIGGTCREAGNRILELVNKK